VRRALDKRFEVTLSSFLSSFVRYGLYGAVGLGVLGIFGVPTTSFAAVIGGASLAIGLAFKGALGNFASGLMLLIFRPFLVGDVIGVGGVKGVVTELTLVNTAIDTFDNRRFIVPNSKVFDEVIENVRYNPQRRVDVDVGCEYSADIDETRRVLEAAILRIPGGLKEPVPQVYLAKLGASSVDWQMRLWCETSDYLNVWQATIRETKMALDQAGIGIPFPQMDVHLDPGQKKAS